MNSKPVWASKTVWGILLMAIPLLQHFGVNITVDDVMFLGQSLDTMVTIASGVVGFIIALYGRVKADTKLTIK